MQITRLSFPDEDSTAGRTTPDARGYRGPVRRGVNVGAGVAVAVVLAALPGCNRGDNPTIGTGPDRPGSSVGTTETAPPDTNVGGQPPLSAPPTQPVTYLKDVRVGARGAGDRVVFEFDTVVPGYVIEYVDRPVLLGESDDQVVTVTGEALLKVSMVNASGLDRTGETFVEIYTGPRRIAATGTGVVTELVQTDDSGGGLIWVVGLTRKVPTVQVSALGAPSRLVLDLAG